MGKLVFAAIVFVVGYVLYVAVRRQRHDMVVNYRLMYDRAPDVYKSIGLGYSSVIVDRASQEVLKAQTATHNAAEILVRRQAIESDVQTEITR